MDNAEGALKKMREICLALPNTSEGSHFGKSAFYVGKKLFATCGGKAGQCQIVFGLEPAHAELLLENDPRFTAYPNAKHAVCLDATAVKDWDEIRALVAESHALVAKPVKKAAAPAKKPAAKRTASKKK